MLEILNTFQGVIDFFVSAFTMVIDFFTTLWDLLSKVFNFYATVQMSLPVFFLPVASLVIGLCALAIVVKILPFIG